VSSFAFYSKLFYRVSYIITFLSTSATLASDLRTNKNTQNNAGLENASTEPVM
jgi:hypothetical protein